MGEDAFAELGGGLAGEGDGEDLGGVVDGGEELEEALDEEAGFAGAGGSFDDEGFRDGKGTFAFRSIGGGCRRRRGGEGQEVSHG